MYTSFTIYDYILLTILDPKGDTFYLEDTLLIHICGIQNRKMLSHKLKDHVYKSILFLLIELETFNLNHFKDFNLFFSTK